MKASSVAFWMLIVSSASAPSADLISSGDWSEVITATNLIAGAGSNLPSESQSLAGVTTLSIFNAPGSWTVRAQRNPTHWNNTLTLFIKRTSSGSGAGTISGGSSFIELDGSSVEIFSGSGPRSNISLQYKITGLSKSISAETYLSSITFSVQ